MHEFGCQSRKAMPHLGLILEPPPLPFFRVAAIGSRVGVVYSLVELLLGLSGRGHPGRERGRSEPFRPLDRRAGLRDIGKRYLAEGRETDRKGQLRLMYRTPNWEDFVLFGTTEIRQYGHDSIQVQRRLRAMLRDLIESLPERRRPLLQNELAVLADMSRRAFPDLADQTLAEEGDLQGIGGSYDEVSEVPQT